MAFAGLALGCGCEGRAGGAPSAGCKTNWKPTMNPENAEPLEDTLLSLAASAAFAKGDEGGDLLGG